MRPTQLTEGSTQTFTLTQTQSMPSIATKARNSLKSRNYNRGKIKGVELKREVERGPTFTLTSDLSYIASTTDFICDRKFYARTHLNFTLVNKCMEGHAKS